MSRRRASHIATAAAWTPAHTAAVLGSVLLTPVLVIATALTLEMLQLTGVMR